MKLLPHERFLMYCGIICYIAFMALCLTSCKEMSIPDWNDLINNFNDPIEQPDTTCTEYVQIDTPLFVGFFTKLDTTPPQYVFEYHNHTINLDSFLGQFGQVHTYYRNGAVGGIINGTANSTFLNKNYQILLFHHQISFYSYGFHLAGALTFSEFYSELVKHPSIQLLTFWETDYTCSEIEKIFAFILKDCKAPPKDIYCLTYINQNGCDSQLLQDQLDELQLRGSAIHN